MMKAEFPDLCTAVIGVGTTISEKDWNLPERIFYS